MGPIDILVETGDSGEIFVGDPKLLRYRDGMAINCGDHVVEDAMVKSLC